MQYEYSERYRRYMKDEYRNEREETFYSSRKFEGLRRSRNGILFGVCQGLADWLEIPAWPLRVGAIIAFIASGFYPIGVAYLVAALLMKPACR